MITFESSSVIVPSKPTPKGLFLLSEGDQVMQWTRTSLIFIYKPTNNNTIPLTNTETDNFSKPCIGSLPSTSRPASAGSEAAGYNLIAMPGELNCQKLILRQNWMNFYTAPTGSGIIQHLFPKVDYTSPIEEWSLFLVQLTRFRFGGLCVSTSISQILADGPAITNFVNSWAKLARGEHLGCDKMPLHDRTMLRSRELLMPPRFDHIEFTKQPLLLGSLDTMAEQKKETSVSLVKITKEQVEGLQKKANETMVVTRQPYTRYKAIAGHIRRCACKARACNVCQPTRVCIRDEVCNRLKPPLPQGYLGNAIFDTVTLTCLYGNLLSKPFSYAVGKLREAIERLTDEYISSALDFIASHKNVGPLRKNFHIKGYTEEATFLENPNLEISS